jgi:hypothetical protein
MRRPVTEVFVQTCWGGVFLWILPFFGEFALEKKIKFCFLNPDRPLILPGSNLGAKGY